MTLNRLENRMGSILHVVKKYGSLVSFILAIAALASLLLGAYDVKITANDAKQKTVENRRIIDRNHVEFRTHVDQSGIETLRSELKQTRQSVDRLRDSLEDIKREFIKRGINKVQ